MARARGFSVVLHDVQAGTQTKQDVIDHVMAQDPKEVVVAQEQYPDQEGKYHIHVFYRLSNPRHFKAHLKFWVLWWKAGRVQVDAMLGTMAECCRYVMADQTKKDKHCDSRPYFYPSQKIAQSPGEYADEWLDWFISSEGPNHDMLMAHAQLVGKAYGESFRASARLQAV